MTMGLSTWFLSGRGTIARVDVGDDGVARVTTGADLATALPALTCLGVHDLQDIGDDSQWVGRIGYGSYQTGPDEIVVGVDVNRFTGSSPATAERARPVRLDLRSGVATEMPSVLYATRSFVSGTEVDAISGWRRYQIVYGQHWSVLSDITPQDITRTPQVITTHQWADAVFVQPDGSSVGLPDQWTPLGLSGGRLYLRSPQAAWVFRVFDLDNLVTDGQTYGLLSEHAPWPAGAQPAWTLRTDPDRWLTGRPGGEIGHDLLQAVVATARQIGSSADVLLALLNLESGLRADAYHPAGRYGLLQLTAAELAAAGWTGTPEDYLSAQPEQLGPIDAHLAGLGIEADADEAGLWICLHLTPAERAGLEPGTVLAAPAGPRPELYARYGVADVTRDDRLTVDDMTRYLRSKRDDARLAELRDRTYHLGAVVPPWKTLAEVTDGPASAASLGLATVIVPVPPPPGFPPGQVLATSPRAGSLVRLMDAVEVRVSTAG